MVVNDTDCPLCNTQQRAQPPLALSVPLSRFTSRVGGGSAFYVRCQSHAMKLISSSQSDFQGENNTTVKEGDEFYIEGDTPEKDLSQKGREALGSLRSGKQFLYPDTPEADEFLAKIAERKKLVIDKKRAETAADAARNRSGKQWYEKPAGMFSIAVFSGVIAGVAAFVLCEYLKHRFPHFFHSTKP
jgi:hypothetical protein